MKEDKKSYYQKSGVVAGYEGLRFAGPGGKYVHTREEEALVSLLPDSGIILDVPCGTGRFLRDHAKSDDYTVIRLDYSEEMLEASAASGVSNLIRGNAFELPFAAESFDAVVSLRFVFHYADLGPFFREVARVLKPGGVFLFDSYTWSPFMFPGTPMFLGGRSFIHSKSSIVNWGAGVGLSVLGFEGRFLCSPLVYRAAPQLLLTALDTIESCVPKYLLNVRFWKLQKAISI